MVVDIKMTKKGNGTPKDSVGTISSLFPLRLSKEFYLIMDTSRITFEPIPHHVLYVVIPN